MKNESLNTVIANLKSNGIEVHITHKRKTQNKLVKAKVFDSSGNLIPNLYKKEKIYSNNGGETLVTLSKTIDGNSVNVESKAVCNREERFHKSRGVRIALGRAIDVLSDIKSTANYN